MRAAVLTAPNTIETTSVADRVPSGGAGPVRVGSLGVRGTDVSRIEI